jgi:transcriptional regulator with XRE-family HTH domain
MSIDNLSTPYHHTHVKTRALGDRLRELRLAQGVSQESLARKVDIDPSYLSKIENNQQRASMDTITRLARALRANELELLRLAKKLPPSVEALLANEETMGLLTDAMDQLRGRPELVGVVKRRGRPKQ